MLNNLVFEQRCAASLHECEIVYLFIQLIEIIKYWTTWFTFGLGMFVQILDHCLPKTWRQLPCLLTQVQPPIKRRPRIIHGSIWPVTMPSPARHTSGDLPFFFFSGGLFPTSGHAEEGDSPPPSSWSTSYTYMPTLPHTTPIFRTRVRVTISLKAFLCLNLRCSPFLAQNFYFSYS